MQKIKKVHFRKVRYTIKNSKYDSHLTIYTFDIDKGEIVRCFRISKKYLAKTILNDLVSSISKKFNDNNTIESL